jgi:dTDP-4-dehydrorhamnose reductase
MGAAGMLGRDLMRLAGDDAVGIDVADFDIRDEASTRDVVARAQPDVVLNCAAYTNVDGAENEEEQALRVNGDGARNAAAAAAEAGAAVLYVSTDYVFDGRKGSAYVEWDEPAPLSAYGRSKLAGERATADANPRHWIVRSSGLFGVGGKNFVETMLGLDRDPIRVVDDQVCAPTYTGHLAPALLEIASGAEHGIHHASASTSCSWHDLAQAVFERAGLQRNLEPCTTDEYPLPAPRPAFSVLGSQREDPVLLPSWQEGLDAYLAERGVRA